MNLLAASLSWVKRVLAPRRVPSAPNRADIAAIVEVVRSADKITAFPTLERQIRARLAFGGHAPGRRETELRRLQRNPETALVRMFDHDGFVREAAVKALGGPLPYPLVAYGFFVRLNDWVPQVRAAAWQALDRALAASDPQILAPAVWLTLQHGTRWQRWGEALDALVDRVALHPRVMDAVVDLLVAAPRAGSTSVFQALSRSQALDPNLRRIAAQAHMPHLRALALNVLIEGRAVWPTGGSAKHWVDKSLGLFETRPVHATRALSLKIDRAELLAEALKDRAWAMRREVLDAMTRHRTDPRLAPVIAECLAAGREERAPSLRSRLDYLAEKSGDLIG